MSHGAAEYIARRALSLVPVWFGVSLFAFALANLAPGDPAEIRLQRASGEQPSREEVARMRRQMGLDAPFGIRYARWVAAAARGDLGTSFSSDEPVLPKLARQLPPTLQLAAGALLLSLIIALPLGVVAAANRGKPLDHFSRLVSLVGTSVPGFVLGYLLILVFAVSLHVFPVAGSDGLMYLVLPVVTLGVAE